jgi:hypothetical protein
MLAGIWYGSMYGGSITSILLRVPGEAASVMTCIDGYEMTKKGRAGPALTIAAVGPYVAGTLSVFGLMFLAPPLASFALRFGPPEYSALLVLGLLVLASMSSGSMPKALAMMEGAQRQPNTLLPAPGRSQSAPPAPLRGGILTARGAERDQIENAQAAKFLFGADRSIYIDTVRVRGPGGLDVPVETKTGVPGGEERSASIQRKAGESPFPRGAYTLHFEGFVDGRPWTETLEFRLE